MTFWLTWSVHWLEPNGAEPARDHSGRIPHGRYGGRPVELTAPAAHRPGAPTAPRAPTGETMIGAAGERQLVARAVDHRDRVAVVAERGEFRYRDLLEDSAGAASALLGERCDLDEARVAFMVDPGYDHVVTLWGAWRAGAMAVPIATDLPDPEIARVLDDATPSVVVADERHADRLRPLAAQRGIRLLATRELFTSAAGALPAVEASRASMMLYTSGTTGRPKGVVHTHRSVDAQITSLVAAWGWEPDDRILLVLPLHHLHGLVNVLGCALWTGATCEMLPGFDPQRTWDRLASGDLSLFMAVPTIYRRLIDTWEAADEQRRGATSGGARTLRLMVSGSAPLPVATLEQWREITGHTLLERYGMTETGMALSNTLDERVPGHVGKPLPGVDVRLVGEDGGEVGEGQPGEIHVRGPTLFRRYWNRPDATQDAFVDGWFRTGDIALVADGSYRILGRASVDIINTGGEQVSALEVEEVLRGHPAISDCAVVGVTDQRWGERVCAAIVTAEGCRVDDAAALREWGKQRLAPSKVPRSILVVDDLPRNAVGKVTKPQVAALFDQAAED